MYKNYSEMNCFGLIRLFCETSCILKQLYLYYDTFENAIAHLLNILNHLQLFHQKIKSGMLTN